MDLELNKAEQIQKILENNIRSLDLAKIGLDKYQVDKIQESINSLAWLIEFFRGSIIQERIKSIK